MTVPGGTILNTIPADQTGSDNGCAPSGGGRKDGI